MRGTYHVKAKRFHAGLRNGGLLPGDFGLQLVQCGAGEDSREAVAASGNLADTLASVRDKDSAEASVAVLDERFTAMIAAFKRLPELQTTYKDTPVDKATVDQFSLKFQSNLARIQREEERLKRIPGLPVAFWKVVKLHGFEMIEVAFSMEGGVGGQADYLNFLRTVRTLYDHNRFEEIVMVDFNGMPSNLAQETRDKLLKLAQGPHFTTSLGVPSKKSSLARSRIFMHSSRASIWGRSRMKIKPGVRSKSK